MFNCSGDSRGAFTPGVRFSNEDISFSLPTGTDVCDIGTFTIWCAAARSFFTRLVFPRTLFVSEVMEGWNIHQHNGTWCPLLYARTLFVSEVMEGWNIHQHNGT